MVTVHDVARVAGVSISTVSRALAEPDRVAAATRSRVVAAAQELGYRPNRAASGLRAGRTGALGLVVPDIENPYFASVTKGAQARARVHGYALFVVDTEEDSAREAGEVRNLLAQTDGVVLASPRADDAELCRIAQDARIVLVNRRVDPQDVHAPPGPPTLPPTLPSVTVDEVRGALQALEHLRALGHRRVVYVGGPERSWSDRQRRAGLERAQAELGDVEVVQLGSYRPQVQGGYSAADLAVASGATAVVAYNDLVAIGLVARLRERGVDVPGAVSVVGFDDTYVATLASPPLTSVGTDLRAVGARAVDLLVGRITGTGADAAELPAELVVRASTAGAPPTA